MPKAIKYTIYGILLTALIAYGVGWIFFKDWTYNMTMGVVEVMNKPLPIIGVSTLILVVALFRFLANTSIGRKALNELKEDSANVKTIVNEKVKKLDGYCEVIDNKLIAFENTINGYMEVFDKKSQVMFAYLDNFEKVTLDMFDKVPNAKVQQELRNYLVIKDEKKLELQDAIGDYTEKVKEFKEEKEKEINDLKSQIVALKEKIENVQEKLNAKTTEE